MSARRFVEEDETNGFWRNYIDPTKEKEINATPNLMDLKLLITTLHF